MRPGVRARTEQDADASAPDGKPSGVIFFGWAIRGATLLSAGKQSPCPERAPANAGKRTMSVSAPDDPNAAPQVT